MTLDEYIKELTTRTNGNGKGFRLTENVYATGGTYETSLFAKDCESLLDFLKRESRQDIDEMLARRLKGFWDGDVASMSFRLGVTHYRITPINLPVFV